MRNFINKLIRMYRENQKKELLRRFYLIRYYITRFFEDLQTSKGSVELPAWIECKNLMEKLEINIENPAAINFYYGKIKQHKLDKIFE